MEFATVSVTFRYALQKPFIGSFWHSTSCEKMEYVHFQNGIYDIEKDEFTKDLLPRPSFVKAPSTGNWQDIDTPSIDKIFDPQGLSARTRKWIWVLLGRALFPANRDDTWHVILAFQGVAGTGKSLLTGHLFSLIYGEARVYYPSNDDKVISILSTPSDVDKIIPSGSLICCATDLPRGLSRDSLTEAARLMPIIVATNERLEPNDNAFLVDFDTPIQTLDSGLGAAIAAELPWIVQKMVRAYRGEMLKGHGHRKLQDLVNSDHVSA